MKFLSCVALASAILAAPTDKPVVGGTPVGSQDVYPWLVALRRNGRGHCGGSLISPTKILTAAHCTVGQSTASFEAFYRRYDLTTSAASEQSTTFKVKKFTVHPKYTNVEKGFDVAIWDVERVSGPVPTKFANLDDGSLVKEGQVLKVAGWGALASGGSSPTKMMETVVPITSKAVCLKAYPQLGTVDTAFCAGYPQGGKDTCQGDSGGPAFVSNEDGSVT
ncbi:hypothetical protein HDV02_000997, partial [Globomyces sp. JEL0801]